ncbi:Terminase OS=Lysinibacillus sphaericus OX=1421 GN=LS41612_04620 PE=4 SV=1 [Lysinibacillus sphaericus]
MLADDVKKGILPDVNLVGKLADPGAFGSERVAIKRGYI